jgi:hypothetical protein
VITLLATSGCVLTRPQVRIGELQNKSESVELDDAKSKSVEINMPAGELYVSGGASELLQAQFSFNVAELEPQVAYRGGTLSVRPPNVDTGFPSLVNIGDYRYNWDLRLNDNVPMKMRVELGIGSADLKLGSLSLTRLDLKPGAAPVTVDLTGNWRNDLDANISGGVGDLTLRLPRSTCVRVKVEVGLGKVDAQGLRKDGNDYVNDACGESEVTLRIHIAGGVGKIKLEVGE